MLACTDPDIKKGFKGLIGFLVDADTSGITKGHKSLPKTHTCCTSVFVQEWNMGQRTLNTAGVTFEVVVVPDKVSLSTVGITYKFYLLECSHRSW